MDEKDKEELLKKIFQTKDFEELNDEDKYDRIMMEGRNLFKRQEKVGDPYGFHKAVELVVRKCKQNNIEIR